MSKTLDDKLNEVSADILKMGNLIQDTVKDAIKAFFTGDVELAQKIIDNDTRVDDYDINIEEKCMYIQAEHQPVAGDLRFIHSIYLIVIYLERIGDIAVSIAKLVKRLYLQGKRPIRKEMGYAAHIYSLRMFSVDFFPFLTSLGRDSMERGALGGQ